MTTPETARTAARETAEWKAIRQDVWGSQFGNYMLDYDRLADAIYNAVNRRLPEPQASKASERCEECGGELSACGDMTADGPSMDCRACRLACEVRFLRQDAAPAGEAVSVARDVLKRVAECVRIFSVAARNPDNMAEAKDCLAILNALLSAPPPSTGDKPKCQHCGENNTERTKPGCELDAGGHEWFCCECLDWFSAPTPPPAPARKGDEPPFSSPSSLIHAGASALAEAGQYEMASELRDLAAAPLSVAPAREGEAKCPPGTCRQCDTCRSDSARVTLPQQGEDDWREKCTVGGVQSERWRVTVCVTPDVYGLTIDSRWLPWAEWCGLPDSKTDFPSESAARAALAQAPRPNGGG
jgi:hypothetical protein